MSFSEYSRFSRSLADSAPKLFSFGRRGCLVFATGLGDTCVGDAGGEVCGLIGREKLTEERLVAGSAAAISALILRCTGGFFPGRRPIPGPRSRLTPLPPVVNGGDPTLSAGSTLHGR